MTLTTTDERPWEGSEHDLQRMCVDWFRYQHPTLRERLFAVPNGGDRNRIVAAKMKGEGVLKGVADLLLLVPRHGRGALLIEMKNAKGRQSGEQKEWEADVTRNGEYRYVVCRSLDGFIREINDYLKED
ncbi:MAG: VRR-NUC domain-containing protein [Prevotellaceae bacterium]|nr:VRR-NUC domain-containing protein [Prevotellaceae bacterium]